jgi:hypothetical protein
MAQDERPQGARRSVSWFEPLQLLRTGQQVAISTLFGRHGLPHKIEAVTPPEAGEGSSQGAASTSSESDTPWSDYSERPTPFWFDYLADTGDGWDATATVAYHVSRPTLDLIGPAATREATERGSVLIFGGDTVYPVPSLQAYEERLLLPFRTMFPGRRGEQDAKPVENEDGEAGRGGPDVFAIPGNHDWYDGLVSFTRLFCSKGSFAGWRAPQRRSYFALRLPQNWWLLGTDLQLGSEIDAEQERFFREVADSMGHDDRIIICHPEPHWIYETLNPNPYAYRSVHRLEARFGERIRVYVSGDFHHYLRHEAADGRHRIVAGGGGAFLHLTSRPDTDVLRVPDQDRPETQSPIPFRRRELYPSEAASTRLALSGPLTFQIRNPSFGLATALAYMIIGVALVSPVLRPEDPTGLWEEIVTHVFTDPFSLLLVASAILGVVLFTDTSSRLYRWLAGSAHASSHIIGAAALAHGSALLAGAWLGDSLWRFPAVTLATAIGGYLVGPLIVSLYLTGSLLVFGRHRDEASSALRCADYKNFLRFRIGPEGDLTIFPVAIDRVARRWQRPTKASVAGANTRTGRRTDPRLIEAPIAVAAGAGHGYRSVKACAGQHTGTRTFGHVRLVPERRRAMDKLAQKLDDVICEVAALIWLVRAAATKAS